MSAQRLLPEHRPAQPTGAALEEAARRAEATAAAERRIADRFARLHAATAALSAALTRTEVAAAIASRGAVLPGASGCAVALRASPGTPLVIVATRGTAEQVLGRPDELPGFGHPLAGAAVGGQAIFLDGDPAPVRGPGEPPPVEGTLRALAALPLEVGAQVLGAVGVVFREAVSFDEEERAFLGAFAHQCAQALDRARLYEAEREARLEAQRAEEAARHAVELQEQLVGIVGHDLRTPLAAIRMSAAVLFRRGGLSPEQAKTVGRIASSASRMSRIIHDLLDFTRVRNEGGIPLLRREADLASLVRRTVAEVAAVHPDREFQLDLSPAAPVYADPDRLAQVVTNLVGNAIQHGPPGVLVGVAVRREGAAVALDVHNDGSPIPDDLVGEIFEPFHRGRRGGEGGSLGLGLFIVREIVRAHGGSVDVRSTAGEGTTFTVRLPASPHGAPEVSTGRAAADP